MVKNEEKKDRKIFLVTQEIELAKLLSGNNKNVRDRALRNLKKWFYNRSRAAPFTEEDFQRIWKGLFYSMWMSDKPLIQEECAENIAQLVHFPTYDLSILFFKAGLAILINEWFGIDQLRLDKFLMLIRRFLRHMLMVLKEKGFSKKNIEKYNEVISDTVLSTVRKIPLGFVMHFIEIYMEELAKVTGGHIHSDSVTEILKPFVKKLSSTDDGRQMGHIRKYIFTYLMRQSDLGMEYQAKYEAWKQLGFPGSINSMQKVKLDVDEENEEISSDEEEGSNTNQPKEKPLDPRAGRVDVELPQIKFNAKKLSEMLMDYKFDKYSTKRGRNMISVLSKQFAMMANGKYPLGITKLEVKEKNDVDVNIRKAAKKLIKFEQTLLGKDRKRKRNNSKEQDDGLEVTLKKKKQKVMNINNSENNEEVSSENAKNDFNNQVVGVTQKKEKANKKVKDNIFEKNENVHEDQDTMESKCNVGNFSKNKNVTLNTTKQIRKIEKSKAKKKNNKDVEQTDDINNIECVFERNSGTWVVFDVSKNPEETFVPRNHLDINEAVENATDFLESDEVTASMDTGNEPEPFSPWNNGSPNKLFTPEKLKKPVKLLESPPRGRALFPRTEWDEALQEGEYEVFVPSKRYLKKMQKLSKKNDSQVLVSPSQNNQVKMRRSLDPSLIKNPFSIQSSSTKKVKINTKLNRSQEIYEHHMQILSSPGIPHDPNKKPIKPVLKSPARTNSINPFYDKQLSIF